MKGQKPDVKESEWTGPTGHSTGRRGSVWWTTVLVNGEPNAVGLCRQHLVSTVPTSNTQDKGESWALGLLQGEEEVGGFLRLGAWSVQLLGGGLRTVGV